jgi:hypothetical protein
MAGDAPGGPITPTRLLSGSSARLATRWLGRLKNHSAVGVNGLASDRNARVAEAIRRPVAIVLSRTITRGKNNVPEQPCFLGVCFVAVNSNGSKFFGFSEFLAGLALMVLAWTIADVRYRFRIKTAPLPLQGLTFLVVAMIGALTVLTDLWRAEGWLVPRRIPLDQASWQALLAGIFLVTFLTWAWFAFLRPPSFSKRNAERYARTLYHYVIKGSATELAVIADELIYSTRELVHYAPDRRFFTTEAELRKTEIYARDILLLIADRRLCREIVSSSPLTALALFEEIGDTEKYEIHVGTFAKNLVTEALTNTDSFLYHETEGYESGLIGYHKPLSQAMFANYEMVEAIGTLLDPDLSTWSKWHAENWKAYCRITLLTFQDYVEKRFGSNSPVLNRAIHYLEHAVSDLRTLNGLANDSPDRDVLARVRVITSFIQKAVEILDKKAPLKAVRLRVRDQNGWFSERSFYDHLAQLIAELIFSASSVKSPRWHCWWIQHNTVWSELFGYHLSSPAGNIVKFKVRRLIYNEVLRMGDIPNFKGAGFLCFCLNVLGFEPRKRSFDRDSYALHVAVISWVRRNYAWLYAHNSRVAEACLVDGMSYEPENRQLVRTTPAEGLRREAMYEYLRVDPDRTARAAE